MGKGRHVLETASLTPVLLKTVYASTRTPVITVPLAGSDESPANRVQKVFFTGAVTIDIQRQTQESLPYIFRHCLSVSVE